MQVKLRSKMSHWPKIPRRYEWESSFRKDLTQLFTADQNNILVNVEQIIFFKIINLYKTDKYRILTPNFLTLLKSAIFTTVSNTSWAFPSQTCHLIDSGIQPQSPAMITMMFGKVATMSRLCQDGKYMAKTGVRIDEIE